MIRPGLAIVLGAAWMVGGAPRAVAAPRDPIIEPMFAWLDLQAPPVTVAVARGSAAYHYVLRREPSEVTADLRAAVIDNDRAYAAGDDGVVLRRTARGGWAREVTPTTRRLRALLGRAERYAVDDPEAAEIYAVGDAGTVLRRSAGGTWIAEDVPTTADLYGAVRADRRLYAVGDRGTLLERRDGKWRAIATGTAADLRSFDGRIAIGRGGAILDCMPWARVRSDRGPALVCVARPSPTDADLLAMTGSGSEWRAYGGGGAVVRAVERDPIDAALDAPAPGGATMTAAGTAPGGLVVPHTEPQIYVRPTVLVGSGGNIAFLGELRGHVVLDGAPDLFGVAVASFDAFAVGAGGTIVHLQAIGLDVLRFAPPPDYWPRPFATLQLDTSYARATDGTQIAALQLGVRRDLPNSYYLADPYYELVGSLGLVSGSQTAYAIAARVGTAALAYPFGCEGSCHGQLMGVSAGVSLDGAGDRIPRAWTIPIDGYWYVRTSQRTRLGPVGGASWAFAGADRGVGWRAGVDLIVHDVARAHSLFGPRHVHLGADVHRLAGATFFGVTVGTLTMNRYDARAEKEPSE